MTRPNRVLPTGEIVAAPFRGSLMGNRGILHDDEGRLGRTRWRHTAWICCRLDFQGRRRAVMTPGRYTELFFWDEAVALAAGHRPCFECRREDAGHFASCWAEATGGGNAPRAPTLDRSLHAARVERRSGLQRASPIGLASLPDGSFLREGDGPPLLLWRGALHPYRGDGYGLPRPLGEDRAVSAITPAPVLGALQAGYRPSVRLSSTE